MYGTPLQIIIFIENSTVNRLKQNRTIRTLLYRNLGLIHPRNVPLLGSISRMVSLKGFDLLAAVMEDTLKLDVRFVMLASGDKELEKKFEQIQKKFPNRFSLIPGIR